MTQIEIQRSVTGLAEDDFSHLVTVDEAVPGVFPNGDTYETLDAPVTPGQLYIYRARRLSGGGYSNWSPPAFARGPSPVRGNPMSNNPYTPTGISSKLGFGIEGTPGYAVKAVSLIDRVSGNLASVHTRIKSKATRNHPGTGRVVLGPSKTSGQPVFEATPERCDELYCLIFGAPVTTAAAGPAAPSAPTLSVNGTAGSTTLTYSVVAVSPQGDSAASATATVTTAPATLNGTNNVTITIVPVAGATAFKILKAGALLGITNSLTFVDQGQATSVYSAPSAASGNSHLYSLGNQRLTASISERRGDFLYLFAGVSGSKLSAKFEKGQTEPFTLTSALEALAEYIGYTEAQLGLDTAGFDPLGDFSVAAGAQLMIGGQLADANKFNLDIDRNLGEKHQLSTFTGPAGHYLKESNHACGATLYFSTDAERKRYMGQAQTVSGPYGTTRSIMNTAIEAIISNPANAGGVVNQFGFLLPNATYEEASEAYPGKDAIMQDIKIYPLIDPVTGTDVQARIVNSRSNANIVTPSTLVTPVPTSAQFNYQN